MIYCADHDVVACIVCLTDEFHRAERWTYPGLETASREEVAARFPEALEYFDSQVGESLPRCRLVIQRDFFRVEKDKLRVSVPLGPGASSTITWMPEVRVWRRYTRHMRSRPRQDEWKATVLRHGLEAQVEVLRVTPSAVWCVGADGTATLVRRLSA